jgi:hypothetical protein
MPILRFDRRRRQIGAVEAGRTMDMFGHDQGSDDRMRAAGEDRDVGSTGQFHQLEAIGDRVVEIDVSSGGAEAKHVKNLRMAAA